MKIIKSISKEANLLRENFQNLVVREYIRSNGSLKGYQEQIYLLLPKYDKRTLLYKNFSRETYSELSNYLNYTQSQRRVTNSYKFQNALDIIRDFSAKDFSICFYRVWHNGTICYSGKHWAAQASALFDGIKKYGFAFYEHDYNFNSSYYEKLSKADPILKSIYEKILERKLATPKTNCNM